MSKKYCTCGKANELLANFCANCGNSFVKLTSTISKPEQVVKKIVATRALEPEEEDDDDLEDDVYVPNINGLEVDVKVNPIPKFSVGGLMSTGSEESANKMLSRKTDTNIKINRKAVLKEISREGSAIRPK